MPPGDNDISTEYLRLLLVDNLAFIEQRCRHAYGLMGNPSEYDDAFRSNKADALVNEVIDHIRADGYRVLREYRGKASLKAYLGAVICNKVVDVHRKKEGRSGPARAASEMGTAGRRLHELAYVKGMPVADAHGIMTAEGSFSGGLAELESMADRISARRRAVAREVSVPVPDPNDPELVINSARDDCPGPDEQYIEHETESRTKAALGEVLGSLPPEERLMITLRFVDGKSVRDVARAIGHTEKNTYRKLRALLEKCADLLRERGVSPDDLA